MAIVFDDCFRALTGFEPLRWQCRLYERFAVGAVPAALDLPTGLGKTSVIAIWLIARALGAKVPRRLVYVVDRRAVVDQATEEAEQLHRQLAEHHGLEALAHKLGLHDRALPISTLRGLHVDNRAWLEDPTLPAIVIGTVDMVGSRLLFEGYGVTRRMRPYHAGLLGADTLLVLDEAHLVPPFEKLIEAITEGSAEFGPKEQADLAIVPPLRLLSLSATGRQRVGETFGLLDDDRQDEIVAKRLDAPKLLTLVAVAEERMLAEEMADRAWTAAGQGKVAVRCLVYCDHRKTAEAVKALLDKRIKAGPAPELFVGGRRVLERELAATTLRRLGFLAGSGVALDQPVFLVATSAAEVGVDLDADHMVCDVVAWERMVQRLGRVNRRGQGSATVTVVVSPPATATLEALATPIDKRNGTHRSLVARHGVMAACVALIEQHLVMAEAGCREASPAALRRVRLLALHDPAIHALVEAATTPAPLRPALSRALVDAWSMTSLKEHTGRPQVSPWLRGWVDELPQTTVVWRTHLPVREGAGNDEIERFFEAAPPHAIEMLETETFRVIEWLGKRANVAQGDSTTDETGAPAIAAAAGRAWAQAGSEAVMALVLNDKDEVERQLQLRHCTKAWDDKARTGDKLATLLAGAVLVVDARLGGLRDGLLAADCNETARTVDEGDTWWTAPLSGVAVAAKQSDLFAGTAPLSRLGTRRLAATVGSAPTVRFRVREVAAGVAPHSADATQATDAPQSSDAAQSADNWLAEGTRFVLARSAEGEVQRWLAVDKWRGDQASEEGRSTAKHAQLLHEHQAWAAAKARDLAQRVGLVGQHATMLAIAARLHDQGKQATRWQRAFAASREGSGVYAKTRTAPSQTLLGGYRHEFGSLPRAQADAQWLALPPDLQDLALHLIAAHHGHARPVIATDGCDDLPPSSPLLQARAGAVALRFLRLQKTWGPWGLAWWEALLRAADQQASRDNDLRKSGAATEPG